MCCDAVAEVAARKEAAQSADAAAIVVVNQMYRVGQARFDDRVGLLIWKADSDRERARVERNVGSKAFEASIDGLVQLNKELDAIDLGISPTHQTISTVGQIYRRSLFNRNHEHGLKVG